MGGVASASDGTYACREWEQGPRVVSVLHMVDGYLKQVLECC